MKKTSTDHGQVHGQFPTHQVGRVAYANTLREYYADLLSVEAAGEISHDMHEALDNYLSELQELVQVERSLAAA